MAKSFLIQEEDLIQGIGYGEVGIRKIMVAPRLEDTEPINFLLAITALVFGFEALDLDPNWESRLQYLHVEESVKNSEFNFVFQERI